MLRAMIRLACVCVVAALIVIGVIALGYGCIVAGLWFDDTAPAVVAFVRGLGMAFVGVAVAICFFYGMSMVITAAARIVEFFEDLIVLK